MSRLDLPHHCRRVDVTEFGSVWPEKDGKWLISSYLCTGNYADSVARSNARVFAKEFEAGEGTWWRWAGASIAIRTLAYRNITAVREMLDGLDDYPLLDENDHSDLEREDEEKNWELWARYEFRRELKRVLGEKLNEYRAAAAEEDRGIENVDGLIDAVSASQIDALFWQWCRDNEEYPEHNGSDVSFPLVDAANAWDGLLPSVDDNGKVQYQTGDIVSWEPIVEVTPKCVRCGVDCHHHDDGERINFPHGLWHDDCGNPVCDIIHVAETTEAKLAFAALQGDEESLAVLQDAVEGRGDSMTASALRPQGWTKPSLAKATARQRNVLKRIAAG